MMDTIESVSIGFGTKVDHAPEAAYEAMKGQYKVAASQSMATSGRTLSACMIDPTAWQWKIPPERAWLIAARIPMREVTMIAGDGGLGKSLVAAGLAVGVSVGLPWLGHETIRRRVILICCEDEPDELHRRLDRIVAHYGVNFSDLADLRIICRVGDDNFLTEIENGRSTGIPTRLYFEILSASKEFGAQLVILDSCHDFFGGNENDRVQVKGFVKLLKNLAMEIDGSVIFLSHPSVDGMRSGSGSSGSTAWNASVRSRLYLKASENEDHPEERLLEMKKANYAERARPQRIAFVDGVFVAVDEPSANGGKVQAIEVENIILSVVRRLLGEGDRISPSQYAPNSLRSRVKKSQEGRHLAEGEIDAAKARLVADGRLVVVRVGPDSRAYTYIRHAGFRYHGEREQ